MLRPTMLRTPLGLTRRKGCSASSPIRDRAAAVPQSDHQRRAGRDLRSLDCRLRPQRFSHRDSRSAADGGGDAVAAAARHPRASQMTSLQIMSRPYTVSQKFAEGNFVDHLLAEVAKVETTFLGIPMSWRVEAHPTIFTTPYEGRPFIKLLVQPPPIKRNPVLPPPTLMVSYHFTHRAGVAVQVYNAGNGTVGIAIVLGDLNPARLPPKHDLTVQWSQLGDEYSYVIDALQIADILTLDILPAIILNRGILTDIYDAPSASSPSTTRTSPHRSARTNSILGGVIRGRQPAVPDLRLAERLVAGPAGRRRTVSALPETSR